MSHQKLNRFRSGSGTMLFGVFFMVTFFAFIMMFAEMYSMQDNYLNTKAATDTIADGTALYAMETFIYDTDSTDGGYNSVSNKASEIRSVINDELGVEVDDISVSRTDYEDSDTITVNTSSEYSSITGMFVPRGYNIATTSGTEFDNMFSLLLSYGIPGEALSDETVRKMLEVVEAIRPTTSYSQEFRTLPGISMDCSSFVSYVLDQVGLYSISSQGWGTTETLLMWCTKISPEEAQPGDLIFFTGNSNHIYNVGHVGIYLGDGVMVHCSTMNGGGIFYSPSQRSSFLCYGRVPGRSASEASDS